MTHEVFRAEISAIVHDLGALSWKPVCEEASTALRNAMAARDDGRMPDLFLFWTHARDEDFVKATADVKAMFSETTGERVLGMAECRRGERIIHRPSAIWLEGKKHRARVARLWSYQQYEGSDLKWAAEVTQFGRACIGRGGYLSMTERKRFERDVPLEYLAEKAMLDLWETTWRMSINPA